MGDAEMAVAEASTETLSLSLDPILDLRAAGPLKSLLQQGLDRGLPLSIDASAVGRMSTACIQVLTAFVLETQKNATALVLKKSSPAFDAAFVNLGLAGILNSIKPQDTK
jgi:anti-anti-sigma regulatory factor